MGVHELVQLTVNGAVVGVDFDSIRIIRVSSFAQEEVNPCGCFEIYKKLGQKKILIRIFCSQGP